MNEGFRPKVSIVIPVYNGANYMREAIDSALAQTYSNIEVLVINDGSNDNGETDRIAKSYGDRIKYFSKPNGGVASALNLGIENMNGDYFSWLSHDDVYKPDKIENQINVLMKHSDKEKVVAGCFEVVNEKKEFLYKNDAFEKYSVDKIENGIFSLLRGCINGCTLLIPKEAFTKYGVFNDKLITTQDFDMFFRIFKGKKIIFCHTFDVLSRAHEEQGSKKYLDFHLKECCDLWTNMIDSLSDEDMITLDGSVFDFLRNTKTFLKNNTLYVDVINYLDKRIIKHLKESKNNEMFFRSNLRRYLHDERVEGYTVNEIISKIIELKDEDYVCFLLGDLNDRGGLNRITIKLANRLSEHYNIIIISNNLNISGYEINKNIHNVIIGKKITDQSELLGKLLYLMNIKIAINVYNCNSKYLDLYKILDDLGIKTVAWNHEFYFSPYYHSQLYDSILERNLKLSYADIVIWINKFSYETYSIFNSNAVYLPNPLIFDNTMQKKGRSSRIIAVGRFDDERKGLTELLRVFSIIAKINKNIVLDIYGKYNLNLKVPRIKEDISYYQFIKELGIPQERMVFHGEVKNIDKFYCECDVHVMTSNNEGFGLVILEAASCGVPTIAFNGSAAEDIITDQTDGYIIKYGDVRGMAERIIDTIEMSDSEYYNLSKNVVTLAEKYKMEIIIKKWQSIIDGLLLKSAINQDLLKEMGMVFKTSFNHDLVHDISNRYELAFDKIVREIYFNQNNNIYDCLPNKISASNFNKAIAYYKRFGLIKTIKKVIDKCLH